MTPERGEFGMIQTFFRGMVVKVASRVEPYLGGQRGGRGVWGVGGNEAMMIGSSVTNFAMTHTS